MELQELIVLGVVSAAAAILGSMLGLGGGVFLVPLFTIFFGIDQKVAIGASAVAVVTNSVVGSTLHLRSQFINLRLGMTLQVTTALGATVGALVGEAANPRLINIIFAAVLLYAIFSMLAQRRPKAAAVAAQADAGTAAGAADTRAPIGNGVAAATATAANAPPHPLTATYRDTSLKRDVTYTPERVPLGVGLSAGAGVLSGMLGIGGGLVQVPVMTILMKVPVKAAAGTSTFMVGFASVATATVYYAQGQIDPQVVVFAMLGVFAGSQIGPRLTRRIATERLIAVFVVIMVFLALSLLSQAAGIPVPWAR